MKKIFALISILLMGGLMMEGIASAEIKDGNEVKSEELCEGVVRTHIQTNEGSVYGVNNINIIEADVTNPNVYFDVIGGGDYSNELATVAKTCKRFNELNEGKTAVAAVNGDMWMVSYAHARYNMSIVAGGYNQYPLVCKKSMTIPRGFNMYDGEIITTAHMTQETPYEGDFWSFGITTDGELVMGRPQATVKVLDNSGDTIAKVDGVNRLPVDNALVLYTDKGLDSNDFSLDDAYEVLIETDGDYKLCHDASIKGKVVGIYDENTKENPPKLAENQILLTARGTRVKKVDEMKIGDEVTVTVAIRETAKRESEKWQKVRTAVGGHIWFVSDGELTGQGAESGYPTTIIGSTKEGKLVLITVDGRQSGFATGTNAEKLKQLAIDLDLYNAFLVDGGGSTTMAVRNASGTYSVANRPSDKFASGTYGSPRSVVNSIIVASVDNPEPEETTGEDTAEITEDGTDDTTVSPTQDDSTVTEGDVTDSVATNGEKKKSHKTALVATGVAAVAAVAAAAAVVTALNSKKKKN